MGKRVISGIDDILTTGPEIAKGWDYQKNQGINPAKKTRGSHDKVWWICDKGHEWEAPIYLRTGGSGCPICSGRMR